MSDWKASRRQRSDGLAAESAAAVLVVEGVAVRWGMMVSVEVLQISDVQITKR